MLPATSTFAICDGLLWMAHCFLMELPETDLRHIRCTLENLLIRANQVLDEFEFDLSMNFDALAIECESRTHRRVLSNLPQMATPPWGQRLWRSLGFIHRHN